jgi:hypothetical protein
MPTVPNMSNPLSDPTFANRDRGPVQSYPTPPTERPTGVTVFAIFGFVFSSLGLLGLLGSVVMMLAGPAAAGNNPGVELFRTNQFYFAFIVVTSVLGMIASVVLFVAGVCLLKMMPLGRVLILAYAVYAIIAAVINGAVNLIYLIPAMRTQTSAAPAGTPPSVQQFVETLTIVSMVGAMILTLAFPATILWYFNRPEIRQRFSARS